KAPEQAVERHCPARWDAHSYRVARRCHAAENLRIETNDLADDRAAGLGDCRQWCRRTDTHRIICERRKAPDLHPVTLRLLGNQCRGDELGHVLPRLARKKILVGESKETVIAARSLEVISVSR